MPGHTHSLDTFSESTVSQSTLPGHARTHSHTGHIFREHCQPVQLGRKCPHSQPGHIFKEQCQPVQISRKCQTHMLNTFSESTVSQSGWAGHARTHSQPGHIFIEHYQPVQLGRKCQDTLTAWTHFQRALSASPVGQEMPGHTHMLDTFSESTVSQSSWAGNARTHSHAGHIFREHCQPVQIARKCWNTLTAWTHFHRALSASPDWQKMPEHTHILCTFSESTVSQSRLAGNARTDLQPGHNFREHCQPVQFDRKCQNTLTRWTHFQRALSASPYWQEMSEHTHILDTFSESNVSQSSLVGNRTHSHAEHIFREVSGVWQDTYSLNIFSANARYDVWNEISTVYSLYL